MFRLPNGKKIDEEIVIMAMEDNDISNLYFLDTKTGKVESVSEMLDDDSEKRYEKFDNNQYIKIPKIPSSQVYNWMKEYTDEFINKEDPEFAEKVYTVLRGNRPFRRFKDLLELSEEGWIHGWDQWKADCIYEEMKEWFSTLPINLTEEFEGFDDCVICQEMKKAEEENRNLSEMELKKAFAKAKEKGAIVSKQPEDKGKSIN